MVINVVYALLVAVRENGISRVAAIVAHVIHPDLDCLACENRDTVICRVAREEMTSYCEPGMRKLRMNCA